MPSPPKGKMKITLGHLAEKFAEYWHELEKKGAQGIAFRDLQNVIEYCDLVDEVDAALAKMPQMKRIRVKLRTEATYEVVAANKEMAQNVLLWCQEDGQKRPGVTCTGGTMVQATALRGGTTLPNHRKNLKERRRGSMARRKSRQS